MWGWEGGKPFPVLGRPALSPTLPTVVHSGDYFLFESNSEEEEEAQPEDPRPSAQSAFQVMWEGPLPAVPHPRSTRVAQGGTGRTDAPRACGACPAPSRLPKSTS